MRTGQYLALGCGSLSVCLVALMVAVPFIEEMQVRVPEERDPRLVGTWRVREQGWRSFVILRSDGSGERKSELAAKGKGRVKWGATGGELYVRFLGIDSSSRNQSAYSVSADGRSVTLDGTLFGGLITRVR